MHDQHAAEPGLTVTRSDAAGGRAVVLAARGEIDMATTPRLRTALHDAVSHARTARAAAVVVDLSGVEFMSSPGLGALIAAHDSALESDVRLLVATGSEQGVLRPLEATQLTTVLDAHPTVDEALRHVPSRDEAGSEA